MTIVTFTTRFEREFKDELERILSRYGLTLTQAIKLFANQIVRTESVPLSFNNEEAHPRTLLLQSIADADAGKLTYVTSNEELLKAIRD